MNKDLYQYLEANVPKDVKYFDLAQLCIGLHIYTDGLPSTLAVGFDKETEAEAFACFVKNNFPKDFGKEFWTHFGAGFHSVYDKGHWLEVIASMYKQNDVFDQDLEKKIRNKMIR